MFPKFNQFSFTAYDDYHKIDLLYSYIKLAEKSEQYEQAEKIKKEIEELKSKLNIT